MRYIYCIFLYMPLIIDICQSGMEIGLAWCGGASARGFKVRVLRWRSLRCVSSGGVLDRANRANRHFCGERCVCSAGLMAAICLPGEVRRPVPGCYLPGGALGVLSVGADASLRAAHCFSIAWISFSSFAWSCASQHSSLRNQLHFDSCHSSSHSFLAVWRMPLGSADSASSFSANWIWWFMGANAAGSHCWASS